MTSVYNQPTTINTSIAHIAINIGDHQLEDVDDMSTFQKLNDGQVLDKTDLEANVYVDAQKPSVLSRLFSIIYK